MRMLLPPSETKRDGGNATAPLDLARLSFPSLTPERRTTIRALKALSRNLTTMAAALRLGDGQKQELLWNRALIASGTMPAIERFTGVLYDGIDVPTLDAAGRRFAARTVVVSSALFGLLGADDPIPAYRLSHDSRLPGTRLRALWSAPIAAELSSMPGLVLDLRSNAYAALGPLPGDPDRYATVRVVAEGSDGTARALNHFNKKGKGELVRRIIDAGIDHPDVTSILDWADGCGIRLRRSEPGMLQLTVDESAR